MRVIVMVMFQKERGTNKIHQQYTAWNRTPRQLNHGGLNGRKSKWWLNVCVKSLWPGPWFVPGQQGESDQQGGILLRRQSQCHAHHSHGGSSSSNIRRRRSSKRRMCQNVVELRCCTYLEIQDLFLQIDACMKTTHPCCWWLFCASRYGIFMVQAEIRCIVRINFYTLCSSCQHNANVQITFIEWIVFIKKAPSINIQTHPFLGSPRLNCLRLCKQGDPVEFMATCLKNREALSHIRSGWKLEEKKSRVSDSWTSSCWCPTKPTKDTMSNEKSPGCLRYIGGCPTQLNGDYNEPS